MADDDMSEETRERLERERQARVHQEAHEPTGDWIELADDPDEAKRVADRYTPTITNDAAKDALKIYVQFAGKPHDAMRAAILSVLPGLTLGREQEAFRRGVAIGKAEGEASELYPASWSFREIEAERRHRETLATISQQRSYDEGFRAGMAIGKAEAEGQAIDGQLLTSGPSDYEVWRDALLIAAQTVEVKGDPDEVVYVARKLVGTLRRTGARIADDPADDFAPDDVLNFTGPDEGDEDEEDCLNCGSDDEEHEEGCPREAESGG